MSADLLERVERYIKRTGAAPSSVGRQAANDPCFVADLRAGRRVYPKLAERVTSWLDFAEQQP